MKIQANGSAEFENIFARISDSKRDSNGFPDPAIAADVGDSSIFWARILDFACISNIFVIRDRQICIPLFTPPV